MLACRACPQRVWMQRALCGGILHPSGQPIISKLRAYSQSSLVNAASGHQRDRGGGFVHMRKPSPVPPDSPKWQQSLLRKQLQHFDDPFHMAKHVDSELAHGRWEQALEFTRKASATSKCIVAWNYLIRHTLKEQRLRAALKLFSEMKRRGQPPNAQTYTIIFTGLARSEHPQVAVAEAVKLYQSLLAGDRVEPNEIHFNAVVNVCARARDMDTMFSVIDLADDKGIRPSRITYAIILHALRANIEAEEADTRSQFMTPEQIMQNRDQLMHRSKTIWDEVIRRWRSGKLLIDEELVCAMGRILLLGRPEDVRAIFDLIEQTMRIPNIFAQQQQKSSAAAAAHSTTSEAESAPDDETKSTPVPAPAPVLSGNGLFVRPGNNTLSLITQVLTIKRFNTVATKYWNLLTEQYNIVPDSNNWHWLMTALKRSHASARAAEVLESMPRQFLNYTTFRMAMATCYRDTSNPNVYGHADRVMATALQTLPQLDHPTTSDYLTIITSRVNHARWLLGRDGQKEQQMDQYQQQEQQQEDRNQQQHEQPDTKATREARDHLKAALASVNSVSGPLIEALDSQEYSGVDHNALKAISGHAYNKMAELVSIARGLVALYDKISQSIHLPSEASRQLRHMRGLLMRHITAFYVPEDDVVRKKAAAAADASGSANEEAKVDMEEESEESSRPRGSDRRRGASREARREEWPRLDDARMHGGRGQGQRASPGNRHIERR